jgi:hypothetical protein
MGIEAVENGQRAAGDPEREQEHDAAARQHAVELALEVAERLRVEPVQLVALRQQPVERGPVRQQPIDFVTVSRQPLELVALRERPLQDVVEVPFQLIVRARPPVGFGGRARSVRAWTLR